MHLAFLILTKEEFITGSDPRLMFAIDPFHYYLYFNPHLDLHDLLHKGGVCFPNEAESKSDKEPRTIVLNGDNQHVGPLHQKWGIYTNYAGEMLIFGEEFWLLLKDELKVKAFQPGSNLVQPFPQLSSFKAVTQ